MPRITLLTIVFLSSFTLLAQSTNPDKWSIDFNAGFFKAVPGKRFISTGPGWQIEMIGGYRLPSSNRVSLGYFWGATPEVDAIEYEIFNPRDHPIWFESGQIFLQYDKVFSTSKEWLQPSFGYRAGYTKEFSEYSGPTVVRKGIIFGLNPSITIVILKFLSFNSSALVSTAFLGNPDVFGETQSGQLSSAIFLSLNSGFGIRF